MGPLSTGRLGASTSSAGRLSAGPLRAGPLRGSPLRAGPLPETADASPLSPADVSLVDRGAGRAALKAIDGDDFTRRIVSVAFLVRLLSLLAGLLGWQAREVDGPVLALVVALGLTSYLGTARRGELPSVVLAHPSVAMLDVLLVLLVVSVAGVDSPLVFATFSTALLVGVVLPVRVAVLVGVVLVGGYTMVWHATGVSVRELGFSAVYGTPLLYGCLIGIGAAVRSVHLEQVEVMRALATSQSLRSGAEERARLAREMHDSLAKTLHGLALSASALPTWVARDPARAQRIAGELAGDAERAAAEARGILNRMRADQPDRPLAQALGERCRAVAAEHGLSISFTADVVVDVPADVRYEVSAVVDEALHNTVVHADASHVQVVLTASEQEITVVVTDNGSGFVPRRDGSGPAGHYGLRGMHERAAALGGGLEVASAPGDGTSVSLRLPRVAA